MSPEARELLRQLLEPDPARRTPLAAVLAHPWFLRNLPPGYTQLNEALLVRGTELRNGLAGPEAHSCANCANCS